MSLLARLGYSALAVTTLGGGGTTIALSSKSSSTQELPLAETVALSPQESTVITETVSETQTTSLTSPSSEPSLVVNSEDSPQGPTQEAEERKASDPVEEHREQVQNLLQEGPEEVMEDTEDEMVEEEGPEGNCKFISFVEEKVPEAFGVTEKDYFSIFCKDEGRNSLPEGWIGWFPKDLFEMDVEQVGNKGIDIKVDDAPGLDEDDWFGARFNSPKFKNNKSIDARWTYYSEDSDWAEVELISANNTKAYLLLTEDSDDEEHED